MGNRFVFVAPAYNATNTIERMLSSVAFQTYDNWLILIRNDMSTDDTSDKIWSYSDWLGISDKVKVVDNTEKLWEMRNVLEMIRDPLTKEDDIIVRIDGDDFLSDLCALEVINKAYNQTGCEILWTRHSWNLNEQRNVSKPLPDGTSGKDIYELCKQGWWGPSHLKTFRKYLLNDVKEENYYGPDGKFAKRAGDRYLILPALYKADKNWCFLNRSVYYYTINDVPETYSSDDAKFQKMEADFLASRGFIS